MPEITSITARQWVAITSVVGGVISILLKTWQGDPQAIAVTVAGVALIAMQALVVALLGLYEEVRLSRRTLLIAVGVFYFSTVGVFAFVFAYLEQSLCCSSSRSA